MTGDDYKEQYLHFIRNEQRRSNIMTMACIQPCLRKILVIIMVKKYGQETLLEEIKQCFHKIISFVPYGKVELLILIKQ